MADPPTRDDDLRRRIAELEGELESAREQHRLLEAMLENAPLGVELYDEEGVAAWLNSAMVTLLGIPSKEAALGKFNVLTDPFSIEAGLAATFERAYAGETVSVPEFPVDLSEADQWGAAKRKAWLEMLIFPVRDASGRVAKVGGFAWDVTQRKEMEARLATLQRNESIAVMAGGIAHDFNNLLTAIVANASLALEDVTERGELRESLENIVTATLQATDLTQQLLAYAGAGSLSWEPVAIGPLAREMQPLLSSAIPRKVTLDLEIAEEPLWVEGDSGQLRQVIMNLVTNASEAIGEGKGTVAIRVRGRELDSGALGAAMAPNPLSEGRYVVIEVEDDGCGMSPEVARGLFDPYFTTKGRGRGLGMAAVLGILKAHRGGIIVEGRENEGTRIEVLLPARQASEARRPRRMDPTEPGQGTILVVDDEDMVRRVVRRMLERAGYLVIEACDGRAGVDAWRAHADEIHAVILDHAMPEMDGSEALAAIREHAADLPVIVSSGFVDEGSGLSNDAHTSFLAKPYNRTMLLTALEAALRGE